MRRVLDATAAGEFTSRESGPLQPLFDSPPRGQGHQILMADLPLCSEVQDRLDGLWRRHQAWRRAVIVNIDRAGHFSSDQADRKYAEKILGVAHPPIEMPASE
jgi:glucan phosphorylase